MSDWGWAYRSSPPWAIGRPQPAFVELVRNGEVRPGRVLDVGCGTGDNAIFLSKSGFSVVGIDIVPRAIQLARSKVIEENVKVDFIVGSALELHLHLKKDEFDNVIDSGFFHTLGDNERRVFAKQVYRVLRDGGNYFMLCFSDKEPGLRGPRRVSKMEINETFSSMFRINYIRETIFATRIEDEGAKAYITSATKVSRESVYM